MIREETIKWLESLKAEIGKSEHRALWHYAEAIDMAIESLSADYEETNGVIKIKKQSAKDVGEIKHIVVRSPNYTRYFYNDSMPTAEPSGDLVSREAVVDTILETYTRLQGQTTVNHLIENIDALPSADRPQVAYICDGRKCDNDCSECFRTLDIEHARDFKLLGDTYYQQEQADRPKGERVNCDSCIYKTMWQEQEKAATLDRHTLDRPKGEWIDTGSGQECSKCHEIQYGYDSGRHYCPNCGTIMEK